MKGICPHCEKVANIELVNTQEDYLYKRETYTVDVEYYKCSECGSDFEAPKSDCDPVADVYKMAKERNG